MSKKYYVNNMIWGWFMCLCVLYLSWGDEYKYKVTFLAVSIAGSIFYPIAKWMVECFFLKFTTKEFWNRGLFMDTPGKMGGLALYSGVVFFLSVPIIMIYMLFIFVKRGSPYK